MEKTTLRLELPSDPRWVNIAEKNIHRIREQDCFRNLILKNVVS